MAKPAERSAARLAAVQALYQMDVAGKGVIDALAEFEAFWIGQEVEGVSFKPAENAFFRDILAGVVREQRAIDAKVNAALAEGWPLKRVEAVLRAVLRAGAYELLFRKDVPARVVITEYVDVTHSFYGDDEPGLVNAVLDAIAHDVRAAEFGEGPRAGAQRRRSGR
jgi:transcription antitermination protein NusB